MAFKVAGCAGHGGFGVTPGKRTPDGEYEWDFNNKVICAFEEALGQYEGVEFLRTDDGSGRTDVPLQNRTDKANAWKADIYISFHHNANTAQWGSWGGTETFNYKNTGNSLKLAKAVHPKVLAAYGLRDRGIKDGSDLWIIRKTNMPAILIEGGFMDSTTDISKLRDNNVLRAAGYAVAEGVAECAGLKKKASTISQSVKPSIVYEAHIQTFGWQGKKRDGETAGTIGQSLRLEALTVKLENSNAKLEMEGHIENLGWTSIRTNGEVLGTIGESLRLEAIKIKCDGLNVAYRVHVQNIGWTDWKKNGEVAGTTGQELRIEAIEMKLM